MASTDTCGFSPKLSFCFHNWLKSITKYPYLLMLFHLQSLYTHRWFKIEEHIVKMKDKNRENNNFRIDFILLQQTNRTSFRQQTADCYEIVSITSVIPFHYHTISTAAVVCVGGRGQLLGLTVTQWDQRYLKSNLIFS